MPRPAAKLVLDKLTFLCIGHIIEENPQRRGWMEPLNLAICDDLPEERKALLALLEQAPIATNCTTA